MEQRSPDWFASRYGFCTASKFSDVLSKGDGKTRNKYLLQVVAERVTGKPQGGDYSNSHMARGVEQEPIARFCYESETGNAVDEASFIKHAELRAGGSPDGLVGLDGIIEIKCVIPTVQIATINYGGYPIYHKPQIMGYLWATGRKWCDFVSYSPDMPGKLALYVFRIERDETYIANLDLEIRRFLVDVDSMLEELKAGYGAGRAAITDEGKKRKAGV